METEDAATWLGINENTLRKAAAARQIPGMKAGGKWLFSKSGIKRYMSRPHLTTPAPSVDAEVADEGVAEADKVDKPCGIGRRATRKVRSAVAAGGAAGETPSADAPRV